MRFFTFTLVFCFFLTTASDAQRFIVERSSVSFFSDGVIEDIAAANNKVTSIVDASKGNIAFLMNIKDFQFDKKLMQVHFNEKYMESETYPKSSFEGKLIGFNSQSSGLQQVKASGKLSIHGVTRDVIFPGTAEMKDKQLIVKSKFLVKLEDYKIKVPQIVWQNIAQEVEVIVDFTYRPL